MVIPRQACQEDDKYLDPKTIYLTKLCRKGGVVLLNVLIVFVVPSTKQLLLEEPNIREWTLKDI
jgi:hypothetical protein